MFDDKINKILGNQGNNSMGISPKMTTTYDPFSNMSQKIGTTGPGYGMSNMPPIRHGFNMNPEKIVLELRKLLDRMPEVKKATGNLNIEFADGTKRVLKLVYNE